MYLGEEIGEQANFRETREHVPHTHIIPHTWESLKNDTDQYVDEQAVCSAIVHMLQNVFFIPLKFQILAYI